MFNNTEDNIIIMSSEPSILISNVDIKYSILNNDLTMLMTQINEDNIQNFSDENLEDLMLSASKKGSIEVLNYLIKIGSFDWFIERDKILSNILKRKFRKAAISNIILTYIDKYCCLINEHKKNIKKLNEAQLSIDLLEISNINNTSNYENMLEFSKLKYDGIITLNKSKDEYIKKQSDEINKINKEKNKLYDEINTLNIDANKLKKNADESDKAFTNLLKKRKRF